MMEPWFESKGLVDANQVLAYFAVFKLGEPPVDGKTDTNPEGLTLTFGKWAPAVAARLHNGGLSCKGLSGRSLLSPVHLAAMPLHFYAHLYRRLEESSLKLRIEISIDHNSLVV